MPRQKLSLATLPDFDMGKAFVAWQQAMARVVKDLLDRPGDKKARQVVLNCNVVPVMTQDGDVVDAEVDFTIVAKLPPWMTCTRPVGISKDGSLFFSADAPDNPRQATLLEEESDS
jgi:hypothetical protein